MSLAERQDIVKILSQKLKMGSALFIRECLEKSHGVPIGEIRVLFTIAGLKEIEHRRPNQSISGST